jgi:hypothetical protein
MALIEEDTDAPVDNLAALNENGIVLWVALGVELEACEPGSAFEMINRPHPGNLHRRAKSCQIFENLVDAVGNNWAMVRLLRQVGSRSWRGTPEDLADRATPQSHTRRQDKRTRSK